MSTTITEFRNLAVTNAVVDAKFRILTLAPNGFIAETNGWIIKVFLPIADKHNEPHPITKLIIKAWSTYDFDCLFHVSAVRVYSLGKTHTMSNMEGFGCEGHKLQIQPGAKISVMPRDKSWWKEGMISFQDDFFTQRFDPFGNKLFYAKRIVFQDDGRLKLEGQMWPLDNAQDVTLTLWRPSVRDVTVVQQAVNAEAGDEAKTLLMGNLARSRLDYHEKPQFNSSTHSFIACKGDILWGLTAPAVTSFTERCAGSVGVSQENAATVPAIIPEGFTLLSDDDDDPKHVVNVVTASRNPASKRERETLGDELAREAADFLANGEARARRERRDGVPWSKEYRGARY